MNNTEDLFTAYQTEQPSTMSHRSIKIYIWDLFRRQNVLSVTGVKRTATDMTCRRCRSYFKRVFCQQCYAPKHQIIQLKNNNASLQIRWRTVNSSVPSKNVSFCKKINQKCGSYFPHVMLLWLYVWEKRLHIQKTD